MARITFRLILLNAFNNPMYCKAVCNRDAFNVFVYPNGNIIFMYICFTMLAPLLMCIIPTVNLIHGSMYVMFS